MKEPNKTLWATTFERYMHETIFADAADKAAEDLCNEVMKRERRIQTLERALHGLADVLEDEADSCRLILKA